MLMGCIWLISYNIPLFWGGGSRWGLKAKQGIYGPFLRNFKGRSGIFGKKTVFERVFFYYGIEGGGAALPFIFKRPKRLALFMAYTGKSMAV
jgi:hypothetical protein